MGNNEYYIGVLVMILILLEMKNKLILNDLI